MSESHVTLVYIDNRKGYMDVVSLDGTVLGTDFTSFGSLQKFLLRPGQAGRFQIVDKSVAGAILNP